MAAVLNGECLAGGVVVEGEAVGAEGQRKIGGEPCRAIEDEVGGEITRWSAVGVPVLRGGDEAVREAAAIPEIWGGDERGAAKEWHDAEGEKSGSFHNSMGLDCLSERTLSSGGGMAACGKLPPLQPNRRP